MMKTCCSEVNLNLELLSNFLNFGKKIDIKKELFQLCFILSNHCVKTEKGPFYCISWKFYTKKIEIILIMISNDLQ